MDNQHLRNMVNRLLFSDFFEIGPLARAKEEGRAPFLERGLFQCG
jgi:hypothetical protein